jgi:dienelactone hydrolase
LRGAFRTWRPYAPTLILHASEDPLVRACRERVARVSSRRLLSFRVFAGAHHSFDNTVVTPADRVARRRARRLALRRLVARSRTIRRR